MDEEKKDNIGGTLVPRTKPPEGVVTTKYLATVIYDAVSSVSSPDLQISIMSAQPAFQKLAEPVLYACAHDDQPVGPRIGIHDVPEPTLKALSGYELERRGRKRERFWWIIGGIGLAFLSAFATWLFT